MSIAATDRLGTFERLGDYIDVRFERDYRRPIESVWKALTEPARLSDWMGHSYVEPFVGDGLHVIRPVGGEHLEPDFHPAEFAAQAAQDRGGFFTGGDVEG